MSDNPVPGIYYFARPELVIRQLEDRIAELEKQAACQHPTGKPVDGDYNNGWYCPTCHWNEPNWKDEGNDDE